MLGKITSYGKSISIENYMMTLATINLNQVNINQNKHEILFEKKNY